MRETFRFFLPNNYSHKTEEYGRKINAIKI